MAGTTVPGAGLDEIADEVAAGILVAAFRRHGVTPAALAAAAACVAQTSAIEPDPVPGLPDGWKLDVRQALRGAQKWGYLVADSQGDFASGYRWATSEAASSAGVRAARSLESGQWPADSGTWHQRVPLTGSTPLPPREG